MSVHILFGPGGAGKSYYQMRIIERQLLETERNIVTNLTVDVPKLAAYMERVHPRRNCRVGERFRILTKDETLEFWKYRGPMKWNPLSDYEMTEDKGERGCCFIIDEAGVSGFSAQGWAAETARARRGIDCCFYLDQQRKHSDDVFASTNGNTPAQIAKGFRDKAHYFIGLRNGYLQSMGIFKARAQFTARWYTREPSDKSEPTLVETWKLDASGLAGCYRTQDGVGVIGRNADKGQRAKGIPVILLIPAGLVVALLCVAVPWALAKGTSKFIQGGLPETPVKVSETAKEPARNAQRREGQAVAVVDHGEKTPVGISRQNFAHDPLTVSGLLRRGAQVTILFSDGSAMIEGDPRWAKTSRAGVEMADGRLIPFKRPSVGSGVKVTPVRPGDLSPVVAVSDSPTRSGSGGLSSTHPLPASPPSPVATPSKESLGAWYTDEHGVNRLREPVTLGGSSFGSSTSAGSSSVASGRRISSGSAVPFSDFSAKSR